MAKDETNTNSRGRKGYLADYTDEMLIDHLIQCFEDRDGKAWVERDTIAALAMEQLNMNKSDDEKFDLTKAGTYVVNRVKRLQRKGVALPTPKATSRAKVDWTLKAASLNARFQQNLSPEQMDLLIRDE